MLENDHHTDLSQMKLICRVNNYYKLDAFESFHINKNKVNLMNENEGPIKSSFFQNISFELSLLIFASNFFKTLRQIIFSSIF